MSAAAAKRTVLAAATVVALVALAILAPAGGATSDRRDRQSPTKPTHLRVIAATTSLVSIAWDPSTDDDRVEGYYIFGNKGKATVDVPAYTVTELRCGESTLLSVIAFDEANNRSEKANLTVATAACPDTQPPATPSGFTQLATTRDAVVLGWNPSPDDTGVVEYGVYREVQRIATPTEPDVTLSGLACGSTYPYAVDAVDAAGNRSARANVYVRTAACATGSATTSDGTPPSTPTALAASGITQTAMSLSWNASTDNVGVVAYDLFRNGTKIASPTSTSASQSGLTCGTAYGYAVSARDAAGNTSPAAQLSVSTSACSSTPAPGDSIPPSTPTGLGVSGATRTSVSLQWGASTDNVGVAGYRIYVNGVYATTTPLLSVTVSGLTCGSAYLFEVDAVDIEGNDSAPASVTGSTAVCADTQAPSAPQSIVATSRTTTSIALTWSASTDNVGVVGYGLYRGGTQVGTSNTTTGIFSGLTCNTNYTLAIDAVDAAGNRSQKATVMVATTECPDTVAPSTPTGLAVSNVSASALTLSWNASTDNVGVTAYDVYRNGTKMGSVSGTSSNQTGLGCGTSYTFAVVARDAAGNSSQQASINGSTTACASSVQQAYFAEQFDGSLPGPWFTEPVGAVPALITTVSNGSGGNAVRLVTTPTSSGPNASSELSCLYLGFGDSRIHTARGEETWYRVRARFPAGAYYPTTGQWNWHIEWHNDGRTSSYGSVSTALGVYTDYPLASGQVGSNPRLALRLAGGLSSSPVYESHELPSNSLKYDHWYDLVFRIRWGTDQDGTGRIGWWVDGTQVLDKSFPMLQRNPDGSVDHPAFGVYNYRLHDPAHTSEVQFDSVVIGPSAASVGFGV